MEFDNGSNKHEKSSISMLSIGITEHLLDSLIFLEQYLSFAKGSMFDYWK